MAKQTDVALAKNAFVALPTDKRAAADAYDVKGNKVINSIQKQFDKLGLNWDVSDLIRGGKQLAKLFPIVKAGYEGITQGNILDRVMASTDLLRGLGMAELPGDWGKTVTDLYDNYGDYVVHVNEVATIVNGNDWKDLQGIGRMINQLAGSNAAVLFTDQDGLSGLAVSVIEEATRYGIPDSFDKVTQALQGDTLIKVANGVLPVAIERGDLQLLRDVNRTLSSGNVWSKAPGVLRDIARNYEDRLNPSIMEAADWYDDVLQTFEEVNATWHTYVRVDSQGVGRSVSDASAFNNASDDMIRLLEAGATQSTEWQQQMVLVGTAFKPSEVESELRRQYPLKATLEQYIDVDRFLPTTPQYGVR